MTPRTTPGRSQPPTTRGTRIPHGNGPPGSLTATDDTEHADRSQPRITRRTRIPHSHRRHGARGSTPAAGDAAHTDRSQRAAAGRPPGLTRPRWRPPPRVGSRALRRGLAEACRASRTRQAKAGQAGVGPAAPPPRSGAVGRPPHDGVPTGHVIAGSLALSLLLRVLCDWPLAPRSFLWRAQPRRVPVDQRRQGLATQVSLGGRVGNQRFALSHMNRIRVVRSCEPGGRPWSVVVNPGIRGLRVVRGCESRGPWPPCRRRL